MRKAKFKDNGFHNWMYTKNPAKSGAVYTGVRGAIGFQKDYFFSC